jgi:hypothetical protein
MIKRPLNKQFNKAVLAGTKTTTIARGRAAAARAGAQCGAPVAAEKYIMKFQTITSDYGLGLFS